MTTRRSFTFGLAGATAGATLARRAGVATRESHVTAPRLGGVAPAGELAERVRLTGDRLTRGGRPAYTREFVLADVALDPPRRFSEFSGDLSGRYVEALSILPVPGAPGLTGLVGEILGHQRPDGRFGDPALRYIASEIALPHMALLWGNGRLLVGLLQCHARTRQPEVLEAARRLADFLVGVRAQVADPAVAQRVAGQGAFGIICFTQLVEPLVALAGRTGDGRYVEAARMISRSLGPRGIQHAHGYLTTLRGLLDLARETGDAAVLARVETLYQDLVASPDRCWMGGVLEYFGWEDETVTPQDRAPLVAASGGSPRDEGCGVADFLRLSLGLHRATGRPEYLERAERCLVNHLRFNQFTTGDFGSRTFFRLGTKPTENVDRAWWCCTMHGYRAFADVLAAVVREGGGALHVDLLEDVDWEGEGLSLSLRNRPLSPLRSVLRVDVTAARRDAPELALRRPAWSASVAVTRNGSPVAAAERDGYLRLPQPPRAGDRIEVLLEHRVELETRDGRRFGLGRAPADAEALLVIGPHIYAVDDGLEPLFFGEPWLEGNRVHLPARLEASPASASRPLSSPRRHIVAAYGHAGFAGTHPVVLRPVGEQAGREPGIVAAWLRYDRSAG